MNKLTYLNDKNVKAFIQWLLPRISNEIGFHHHYYFEKMKHSWACTSIYDAYEQYVWPFACILPSGERKSGRAYSESEAVMKTIQDGMNSALDKEDPEKLLSYSLAMLEWGGVKRSNDKKLQNLGAGIVLYFQECKKRLDTNVVDLGDDFDGILMNSGFTKLYSLVIDDFIIYDSRVGAALGLLVRMFLEETGATEIPKTLDFAFGLARPTKGSKGKVNRRDPSTEVFRFRPLYNSAKKHIDNNIRANWLVAEVAAKSKFAQTADPIRNFEAALFMIGYNVRTTDDN